MAYNYHNSSASSKPKGGGGGQKSKGNVYGRVVKTVLSLSDPDCTDSSMLNGVFYRVPKLPGDEAENTGIIGKTLFAKQGDASIRVIPMEGELVEIVPGLGTSAAAGKVMYWGKIVNVWNHPHHNAIPDIKQQNWGDRLIGGQTEEATINPLQANPGDTLIEGRLGQSVRFGGYKGIQSKNIDSSNDGKPIILISNGQIKTEEGDSPIEEDVNQDFNSIHLLSDHKSDLIAINTKRDSYDVQPVTSNQYVGNQVIVNGGRLFFNAKEDSAFISAKESVGLNARTLNFDAKDYICIDAKKIYLGVRARTSNTKEPVVLGIQLENWLISLLDTLESVAIAMSSASAVSGGPVTQLNAAGPELQAVTRSLKTQLRLFQSKKVFTE
jgi:hypothetical protein